MPNKKPAKNNKKTTKKDIEKMIKNKQNQKDEKKGKPLLVILIIAMLLALIVPYISKNIENKDTDIALSEFVTGYNELKYEKVLVDNLDLYGYLASTGTLDKKEEPKVENKKEPGYSAGGFFKAHKVKTNVQQRDHTRLPKSDSITELGIFKEDNPTKITVKDNSTKEFWADALPTIITIILFIFIAMLFLGKMSGVAGNAMSFGKSRARLYDKDKDKVMFKDVAGAEEEKQELNEVVDFLKNPKKYKNIGAKIPKGVLLVGPPGTGKTLIARAVAGESNVPFMSISGSEFVEMFVGVGASRVRDLFSQAKKMAPAIIFIDEIDAIGKKRGPGLGGGHDEREQTLNQILTEMDGFDQDTNVIVMAATNRSDVLDKALLRPGRFDRKITINLPTLEDRVKILEVHAKGKPIDKKVDFRSFASSTVGFSGADLYNLVNEAAIITARENKKNITNDILQQAFERIVMGLTKKSRIMSDEEKKITSYHEVGHALVGKLLPNTDPVHKVSIISRGGALGVTWFLPKRDRLLVSKAKYIDELATLYGGRAAEEIFFGKDNITTGASNDIEKATDIARSMVTRYGMDDEIGQENFASSQIEGNHLGSQGESSNVSDKTQEQIDDKVKEILKNAYKTAINLIENNKKLAQKIGDDLLEKEELNKEEFNEYFN